MKYQVDEILLDKDNSDVFYKILAVALDRDYEGYGCYFVEVLDKGIKYYACYNHIYLKALAERSEDADDKLEFVE